MIAKKRIRAAAAAALAATITLGVGAQSALAFGGELNNANVIASWSWTWTESSASSYSARLNHYAYAQQDTTRIARSNTYPKEHAQAHISNGNEANHDDVASANIGWR